MIGRTLSHYRITAKLGEGGMGEVYLAEDTKLGREVAIKVMSDDFARDRERFSRFQREAKSLATLNHPNIVTIYSVEEYEGTHFLTMELVEGKPLGDLIPAAGLSVEELLDLALPLVEALGAAHTKGIIHRDLKPANVMVSDEGRVKILDFGLAKLQPAEVATEEMKNLPTLTMTRAGAVMGTAPYMSPEQIEATSIDHRTDIFSLGIVLYEMATGNRPFQGSSSAAVVSSILRDTPRRVTEIKADLPEQLGTIIERCLAKRPEDRVQSANEVLDALQVLKQGVASGQVEASGAPTAALSLPSRKWVSILAVLVIVAVLVGVAIWQARLPSPESIAPKIASVAVLPLLNLSGDPEQEFFVDGMTEALITDLSKISALKVISRTSVMRYKGSNKSLPEIARELGVDALVEGSVVREADRVVIRASLIEASSDRSNLWAQEYTRELTSIITLQGEIARAIAREIQITLTPAEKALLARDRPVDPAAYEAFLRGRFHLQRFTPQDFAAALRYFETSLDIDPDYALGHWGVGSVMAYRVQAGLEAPDEGVPILRAALSRALQLDDSLAEAHLTLASVKVWVEWDWQEGEAEFLRAIELNPNDAGARIFYSHLLSILGRHDEGRAQAERALELDPFNPFFQALSGAQLLMSRRYEDAIAELQAAHRQAPGLGFGYAPLWDALHHQGRDEEAFASVQAHFAVRGDQEVKVALEHGYAQEGFQGAMRQAAKALEERSQTTYVAHTPLARLYDQAGVPEKALEWLERAYEVHSPNLPYITGLPFSDRVRADPRYKDLVLRMKLSAEDSATNNP